MTCSCQHCHLTNSRRLRLWLFAVAVGATCAAGVATAQTRTSADQTGTADPSLQEIVVTAEKRESTVQKVPISITAVSGAELAARGITTLEGLAEETPGVSVRSSGPGQTEYELRGLSSAAGASPTVGFYFGETPITPPTNATNGKVAIDPDLFDLNRVEILRGPQGTLYGSGSMGGTIKIVPNSAELNTASAAIAPTVSYTTGGSANYGGSVFFNAPVITDVAAVRVVLTDKFTSGWIDRIITGPDNFPLGSNPCKPFYTCTRGNVAAAPVQTVHHNVNWERLTGARATVLLVPTDRLTIEPTLMYQRITQGGYNLIDNPPGTEAHYQPYDVAEPFADEFSLYSVTAKYKFDSVQLVSASGYWHREERQFQDESEDIQNAFDFPGLSTANGGIGAAGLLGVDITKQFSQELRLESTADGPFQWIGGLYYSHFTSTDQIYSNIPGFLAQGFATSNYFFLNIAEVNDQKAAFGDVSYQITDKLKASAGVRWYQYVDEFPTQVSGVISPTGNDTITNSYATSRNSGVNPKFNLAYLPSDNLTVYGTIAKGFRPGSGNLPVPVTGPGSCLPSLQAIGKTSAPSDFSPDTVWSYELGEKARLMDGKVTINGAVYYLRWNNVQQAIGLACGFFYFDNAGVAAVKGGELEVNLKLTSALTLSENVGLSRARFVGAVPEAGIVDGQRLQGIPDWTFSEALVYSAPVGDGYEFMARIADDYVGSRIDLTYSTNYLPSYNLASARVGIVTKAWQVGLFANNLANKMALISNNTSFGTNLPDLNRTAVSQPRTIGIDGVYRFH
jgi:iron complex outermembrane recepter protein